MGRKTIPASSMNVAEKQNTTLAKRLDELITDTNALKTYLDISAQAINQYRLGISRPSLENLCKIADYYGVTTDYLLGRTTTKTVNEDIATTSKTTGLSEAAVTKLNEANQNVAKNVFDLPELNWLIMCDDFWGMVNRLAIYHHECGVKKQKPITYSRAEERGDIDAMRSAKKDYKFAVTDKELSLFEAQKLLFKIAGNIEAEVKNNAVDQRKAD